MVRSANAAEWGYSERFENGRAPSRCFGTENQGIHTWNFITSDYNTSSSVKAILLLTSLKGKRQKIHTDMCFPALRYLSFAVRCYNVQKLSS